MRVCQPSFASLESPYRTRHRVLCAAIALVLILAGCSAQVTHNESTSAESSSATSATSTPPAPTTPDSTRTIEFSVQATGVETDQTFRTTGPASELRYGNGRLTGSTTIDGRAATAELLAQVGYRDGSGPFAGFWTFTFSDSANLVLSYSGETTASGSDTTIIGDLRVFGGTGAYAHVTGGGTLRGERMAALGGDVAYQFTLRLGGLPAGDSSTSTN